MPAPLDSRQIRAFLALAQTRSFTEAARQLSLSQSAVSHSIRSLEDDLQCRLFDRIGKTARLTQGGEQFRLHAQRILAEMEEARSQIDALRQWGKGRIRLGAGLTICQYLLPAVLREFKESFPQCVLNIAPGDTPALMELVDRGDADFAIALEPRTRTSLEFRPLFSDEVLFMVSPLHPWARAGKAARDDIARQQYIVYARTGYLSGMVDDYFRQERVSLPIAIEMGNLEAIKEFVKLGIGISILAPWAARKELAEGSLVSVPLGKRRLKRRWGLLLRPGTSLNLAQETFLGLCRTVAITLESGSA